MKVLVTGGAGYIGSHVLGHLAAAGHEAVVVDNLSTGHDWAVRHGRLVQLDLSDGAALDALFAAERFGAVLHFAASIVVPESVTEPLKYYGNNTGNTLRLLSTMRKHGVQQLVFSSTAAVYAGAGELDETSPTVPQNPYGWSKLMSERAIADCGTAHGLRAVVLRYFNVAGADPQARIGLASAKPTHLVKIGCEVAVGVRKNMQIYGTDYDTPDGTCVRDYIHVEDLASAHVLALAHLARGGESLTLNCGYGRGYSVREVLAAFERVTGRPLDVIEGPRRPGDAPMLVARSQRIREALGWRPAYEDLELIITHALAWERKYRQGKG